MHSPAPAVRDAAARILAHVNKRCKAQPALRLPVLELARLYGEGERHDSSCRNLCVLYADMGFGRLAPEAKAAAIPVLVHSVTAAGMEIAPGVGRHSSGRANLGNAAAADVVARRRHRQVVLRLLLAACGRGVADHIARTVGRGGRPCLEALALHCVAQMAAEAQFPQALCRHAQEDLYASLGRRPGCQIEVPGAGGGERGAHSSVSFVGHPPPLPRTHTHT